MNFWTKENRKKERKLYNLIKKGLTAEKVAKELNTTISAVNCRVYKLGLHF